MGLLTQSITLFSFLTAKLKVFKLNRLPSLLNPLNIRVQFMNCDVFVFFRWKTKLNVDKDVNRDSPIILHVMILRGDRFCP